MGANAFADRARRELEATGEQVRFRRDDQGLGLTPQEHQIAQLARTRRTNPEIGAELFLSARTVEWHLHNIFIKLGISSRHELDAALGRRSHALAADPPISIRSSGLTTRRPADVLAVELDMRR